MTHQITTSHSTDVSQHGNVRPSSRSSVSFSACCTGHRRDRHNCCMLRTPHSLSQLCAYTYTRGQKQGNSHQHKTNRLLYMNTSVYYYPCETCGQQSYQWCSRCHNAWYCSPTHQQQDWARHCVECIPRDTPTSSALYTPRIDSHISHIDSSVIALLLPWDTGRPRLIRLKLPGRVNASNNTTNWTVPLTEYLGDNTPFSSREITRNVGGEPLRYPMRVFFRDNFLKDGSPLNRSVLEITHRNARHQWAGNIVIVKWSGARRQGYHNMNLNDLHAIAAWFLAYD
ncbi:hypothetical protein OPQ81_007681 [Rhizoctonia solani]|nr:hypothetical protein OPQ81_007681 [Rhizoctonia solani]